jgi:hypothetical protein
MCTISTPLSPRRKRVADGNQTQMQMHDPAAEDHLNCGKKCIIWQQRNMTAAEVGGNRGCLGERPTSLHMQVRFDRGSRYELLGLMYVYLADVP